MTHDEYARRDATALAGLVRAGEVTALELIEVAVRRLEQVNPAINAVVYRMDAEARQRAARARAAGAARNAVFGGVPFFAKDLLSGYAGHPTSGGSRVARDLVVEEDTELVRRVRATGVSDPGQNQRARIRPLAVHGAGAVGTVPEPVGAGSHAGGIERGFGGGGRGRDRADGGWRRRRGLDPHARFVLRPLRAQAHPGTNPAGAARRGGMARIGR